MSAWPKTRKVGDHEVEFTKIKNRKLVNIVNKLAFASAGIGGGGSAPSTPSGDESEKMSETMVMFSTMQKNGDYEVIQDTFFEHMIIPGVVGSVLDDYEKLFDRDDIDPMYDMQLTLAAMEVYISGFTKGTDGKALEN